MNWDDTTAAAYDSERTEGRMWVVAPDLVVTRAQGVGELGAIKFYTARMDRLLIAGRTVRVFHHWAGVRTFEPEARAYLRDWASRHPTHAVEAHYLVGSTIMAMAISAAALALGRTLHSYTDEAKFVRKLDDAIRAAEAR